MVACVQKPAVSRNRIFTVQGIEAHRMLDALRLFNGEAHTDKRTVRLPLDILTLPAWFSDEYRFSQQIMRYYEQRKEQFESDASHRLLYKPTTTLADFARQFRGNHLELLT